MNEENTYSPPVEKKHIEGEAHIRLRENAPRFLLLALILGVVYAILFCRSESRGLNTLLYQLIWCGAAEYTLRALAVSGRRRVRLWYAAILLLALTVIWSANEFVQTVSRVGILLCKCFLFLNAFAELRDWHFFKAVSAVWHLFWNSLRRVTEPFSHLLALRNKSGGKRWKYILIGLLIAGALLLIVLPLLMRSDAAFNAMIRGLFHWKTIPEGIITALRAVCLVLVAGITFYAVLSAQTDDPETGEQHDVRRADSAIAVTFTAVLAVVYCIFCAFRLAVLLRGGEELLPRGYTYAEYAREGFFELLLVSGINLILVIVSQRFFVSGRALRVLLTVISLCTYLMAASSAWRMLLYVRVYGFTFLRLLVLWFLVLTAILLGGTLYTVFHPDFRLFAFSLGVCLSMWLIFAFARPDRIAAQYNFARFGANDAAVSCAIYELSEDGIPILTQYPYEGKTLSEERNLCLHRSVPQSYRDAGWRAWNFSRWEAYKAAGGIEHGK